MARPSLLETPEKFIDSLVFSPECPICTEDYDSIEHIVARIPGCNHVLGKSCLIEWLRSKCKNADKCPLCRKELWRQFDSDDEDADLHFIQRLWGRLCEIASEESPDDSIFEAILTTRRYHRTRWPSQSEILPFLLFTCQVMHSAIRLDDALGLKSAALSQNATYAWYNGCMFLDDRDTFSWEHLECASKNFRLTMRTWTYTTNHTVGTGEMCFGGSP
jgi:hypothetical protein